MASQREVVESPKEQGEDERIPYTLDTTEWGGSPSSPTCVLKLVDPSGDMTVVTSTNVTGSPSISTNEITSGIVHSLTANSKYRLEFKWVTGSKTLESYLIIFCKV